jgi:hypothetical protein
MDFGQGGLRQRASEESLPTSANAGGGLASSGAGTPWEDSPLEQGGGIDWGDWEKSASAAAPVVVGLGLEMSVEGMHIGVGDGDGAAVKVAVEEPDVRSAKPMSIALRRVVSSPFDCKGVN